MADSKINVETDTAEKKLVVYFDDGAGSQFSVSIPRAASRGLAAALVAGAEYLDKIESGGSSEAGPDDAETAELPRGSSELNVRADDERDEVGVEITGSNGNTMEFMMSPEAAADLADSLDSAVEKLRGPDFRTGAESESDEESAPKSPVLN